VCECVLTQPHILRCISSTTYFKMIYIKVLIDLLNYVLSYFRFQTPTMYIHTSKLLVLGVSECVKEFRIR